MNELIKEIFIQIGIYFLIVILSFIAINILTQGFLMKYIKVKASRGKKILINVYGLNCVYYCVGVIDENALLYKYGKHKKRIEKISLTAIYRKMGVDNIDIDDIKNAFVSRPDFKAVDGHDAVKTDSMIERALMLPRKNDNILLIITLIVVILTLLLVGFTAVNLDKNTKLLQSVADNVFLLVNNTVGVIP
jgi:hypothetical protein